MLHLSRNRTGWVFGSLTSTERLLHDLNVVDVTDIVEKRGKLFLGDIFVQVADEDRAAINFIAGHKVLVGISGPHRVTASWIEDLDAMLSTDTEDLLLAGLLAGGMPGVEGRGGKKRFNVRSRGPYWDRTS